MHDLPPIQIDPNMPDDELRLVSPTQMVRITNIGKPKLDEEAIQAHEIRETVRAIEADAIQRPNRPIDWTKRVVTNAGDFERLETPNWNPSPLMRALGFSRNPATCIHNRKRLYLGSTVWRCVECGEELGNA